MELSPALLVAILFSTVIGISLGSLLMTLAQQFAGGVSLVRNPVYFSWLLFLLLVHLSMFWDTAAIVSFERWQFYGLLLIMFGPIALLLATHVLAGEAGSDGDAMDAHYGAVRPRFQLTMTTLFLWIAAVTLILNGVPVYATWVALLLATSTIIAALTSARSVQVGLVTGAWVIALIGVVTE